MSYSKANMNGEYMASFLYVIFLTYFASYCVQMQLCHSKFRYAKTAHCALSREFHIFINDFIITFQIFKHASM